MTRNGVLLSRWSRPLTRLAIVLTLASLGAEILPGTASAITGGTQLWAHIYPHPISGNGGATAIVTSPDGSTVFVTGWRIRSTSNTGRDYATTAYDSANGAKLWSQTHNGPGSGEDYARAIGVNSSGTMVFVTGSSTGASGSPDFDTLAYDGSTGAQVWDARYKGDLNRFDSATALGVSPDGRTVFLTGVSTESTGYQNFATIAYDAATGARQWVSHYTSAGTGSDSATALAVSPDGAMVFVTGYSAGRNISTNGRDYATVAYDASTGIQRWVTRYNGAADGFDSPTALAVSPDGTTVFVTGSSARMRDDLTLATVDYATLAYDASTGARLWLKRYNGTGHGADSATDIGVSPNGATVYVTGSSVGPSSGTDYATVAYGTSSGSRRWVKRYAGPGASADAATALSVSPDGNTLFVTGHSTGSTNSVDYFTIAYGSAAGSRAWANRYARSVVSEDFPDAMVASPDGTKLFVTGFSSDPSSTVFATIAYSAARPIRA